MVPREPSPQLRVLSLGFPQNGHIRVSVFPQSQKILVRSLSFGGVSGKRVGSSQAEVGERAGPAVPDDPAVIDNFLKFAGGFASFSSRQVGLAPYVHRIQAGNIVNELDLPQVDA